jgi:hypothetical protein
MEESSLGNQQETLTYHPILDKVTEEFGTQYFDVCEADFDDDEDGNYEKPPQLNN